MTGIDGPGIEQVYLPECPPDDEVLFKEEQKFTKPIIPDELKEWIAEADFERNKKNKAGEYFQLGYEHPHQAEIDAWEDMQWERGEKGIWFWNNGVKTYITNDHYRYLTEWHPDFEPDYREPEMETFYWIKFWEEDPLSYGGCYNTLRREGKSAKMGFWVANRTYSNFKHFSGMQGEDNLKIQAFYEQHIINPFHKLPSYRMPVFDTNTLQKKGIIFNEPPRRNQKRGNSGRTVLESKMDYRTSEENKYDQAKLHSYAGEEWGKNTKANVWKQWGYIKPCLMLGKHIIGKAFIGTTVEYMDTASKGGRAYQRLCLASNFNKRNANGQTQSGLYAALMPAECALEGYFDEWGRPDRTGAMLWIMNNRKDLEDNPADYASLVRKYPTSWTEVFYTSAEKCEFNIRILQARDSELAINPPAVRRFTCAWENDVRFSKIIMTDSPTGWFHTTKVFTGDEAEWYNAVQQRVENGVKIYSPTNDHRLAIGIDPIEHGVTVESTLGEDGFINTRQSRPVLVVKRKYDSAIDGPSNFDILKIRAKEKYPYKTGVYFAWMSQRPSDPNIFFERCLMVCWLFSTTANIESQKPGVINWFNNGGMAPEQGQQAVSCREFTWMKYVPDIAKLKAADLQTQGTAATPAIIQEYTSMLATDVEYFGHTYPTRDMTGDLIAFDPGDTKPYDFAVAMGNCEIGTKMRPKRPQQPERQISDYFRRFDRNGRVIKMG